MKPSRTVAQTIVATLARTGHRVSRVGWSPEKVSARNPYHVQPHDLATQNEFGRACWFLAEIARGPRTAPPSYSSYTLKHLAERAAAAFSACPGDHYISHGVFVLALVYLDYTSPDPPARATENTSLVNVDARTLPASEYLFG